MDNENTWCGSKCGAGLSKIVIRYDGSILPCEVFKNVDAAILGNINKGDTLKGALENVNSNKFLKSLAEDLAQLRQNGDITETCIGQLYHNIKKVACYYCRRCEDEIVSDEELMETIVKYQKSIIMGKYLEYIIKNMES